VAGEAMGWRGNLMIDHIFVFVEPGGTDAAMMGAMGFIETYRRTHPGQGTQNVCYCFDNLFIELLWVDDPVAAQSAPIRRTGIYDRSLWRTNGACPFGIAWRRSAKHPAGTVPTWKYSPPYLPEGLSIPVATAGDDTRQPMMFESPGSLAPVDWPPEQRGSLQHSAGLGGVREIALGMPSTAPPSDALISIATNCTPDIRLFQANTYAMEIRIASINHLHDKHISLPLLPRD
jgi:Glyoxalase-like domain